MSDEAIDLDTEFFTLGFDSFSIVRLANSLQDRFRITIEASLFVEHQTPRQLITFLNAQAKPGNSEPSQQHLESQINTAEEIPSAPHKKILVPIQTKGRKQPIFAVPGAGASVFSFYPLVNALGSNQPFYALQALEPQCINANSSNLSSIAQLSLKAIKSVQPQGPYRFIGHSLGGLVVYEMVRLLLDDNEEVASVTLLDAFAPKLFKPYPGSEANLLTQLGNDLAALHNIDPLLSITDVENTPPDQRHHFITTKLKRRNLDINESQFSAFTQACQLAYGFEPEKLYHEVDISLCRAKARNKFSHSVPDDYGWQELLVTKLKIIEVEGDHFSMLDKDHIEHVIPYLNLPKTKE
jgi:thioesterase domain-containing protein/acyl carrier protein